MSVEPLHPDMISQWLFVCRDPIFCLNG